MALSIDQLQNGISYWRTTRWPQDFHNDFYEHALAAVRVDGEFTLEWWGRFIRILHNWRATRPYSFAFLTAQAQARFPAMTQRWSVEVAPYLSTDIAELEWNQIGVFPALIAEIKPLKTASPVFTSKFCHFLAPRIFPVVDNTAMRNSFRTYEEYFTRAREEWLGTDAAIRDEMISILTREVGKPLFVGFPMKCKLVELCLIGIAADV